MAGLPGGPSITMILTAEVVYCNVIYWTVWILECKLGYKKNQVVAGFTMFLQMVSQLTAVS